MSISLLELSPAAQKQVLEKLKAKQAAGALRPPAKGNKLHAEKTDGYDSKKESKRAAELRLMEQAGEISNLREQVKFELIPAQYEGDGDEIAAPVCGLARNDEGGERLPRPCGPRNDEDGGNEIATGPMAPRNDKRGKLVERSCTYVADFSYVDNATGKTVVEDVKGYKKGATYSVFVIKRKLMLQKYGIRVKEV